MSRCPMAFLLRSTPINIHNRYIAIILLPSQIKKVDFGRVVCSFIHRFISANSANDKTKVKIT